MPNAHTISYSYQTVQPFGVIIMKSGTDKYSFIWMTRPEAGCYVSAVSVFAFRKCCLILGERVEVVQLDFVLFAVEPSMVK